jgi:hypothetical protein
MKVALTGPGADEIFAGYSNFRHVPRTEVFSKCMRRLPRLARRPISASLALLAGKSDRRRQLVELTIGQDFKLHPYFVHPYFLVRMLFGAADRGALFSAPRSQTSQKSLDRTEIGIPRQRITHVEARFEIRDAKVRQFL